MILLPAVLLTAALMAPQAPPPAAPQATEPETPAVAADEPGAAIEAGLKAFKKRRFARAEIEFRKAWEANPQNAAAAFYLGYTYYKMAEPKRPFHPEKQKAAELFAKAYELDPEFRPVWGSSKK